MEIRISGLSAAKICFKTGKVILQVTLRFTNGGTPVINLSVANNRSIKVGEERKSIADWFKVTVFGRDAEVIAQYAKKGSALTFNGRLQSEKYVDRDGNPRTATVLVASSFEFIPLAKRQDDKAGEGATNGIFVDENEASNSPDSEADDIPF
ncbi:MAG: single-stranded DNA-binding protein [Blastocatellales bacterium]